MIGNGRLPLAILFLLLLSLACSAKSGTGSSDDCLARTSIDFDAWLNCKILQVAKVQATVRNTSNQVEVPSVAGNATSLVDQTAAPNLVGLAMNLAGLSSKSVGTSPGGTGASANNGVSGSVTTTAYALYAAATQHDPLDPAFYSAHTDLRRFSFTAGRDNTSGSVSTNANQQNPLLFGSKIVILNWRDATASHNSKKLAGMSEGLARTAVGNTSIAKEVQDYLYAQLGKPPESLFDFLTRVLSGASLSATIAGLTQDQEDQISRIISRKIDPLVALRTETDRVIRAIRNAEQLSLTFDSKVGFGSTANDYRTGVAFDGGLTDWCNLTLNATFDYTDNKNVIPNAYGGRVAIQSTILMNHSNALGPTRPVLLSTALEAKWLTKALPTYTGQFKLTIPLFNGVSLPLSVSVANRTSLINEKNVYGNFGISIDLARLLVKQ